MLNISEIEKLEALRGSRLIVYCLGDHPSKPIHESDLSILYKCLSQLQFTDRLDLLFYGNGGFVNAARHIALMLRRFTNYLTVLVPHKAKSAASLLCLSANQIVLSPIAEFTALDPHLYATNEPTNDASPVISAEDIRAFVEMAEIWFGIKNEEYKLQLLAILAQRIFPTSISAFYRADKQSRKIGTELLRFQLPDTEIEQRQAIVAKLMNEFGMHDYFITVQEMAELGLNAVYASPEEEEIMGRILSACQEYMSASIRNGDASEVINGVILSTTFFAQHALPSINASRLAQFAQWEVLGNDSAN